MATIKQCKMLAARCSQAGMEYEFEQFKELENGEVDAWLEKIAEFEAQKKPQAAAQEVAQKPAINQARFGMCVKLVLESSSIKWAQENKEKFSSEVKALYELVDKAEAAVSAVSGGD